MGSCYRRERTVKGRTYREAKYTVSWFDHEAKKCRTRKAYRDKKASEELLRQLEQRSDRQAVGLPVPLSDHERESRSWTAAVEAYRADRQRLGRSTAYVTQTVQQLTDIGKWCGWTSINQMRADRLREFLAALAAGKIERKRRPRDKRKIATKPAAPKTANAYRDAAVGFGAWCVEQDWLEANPLEKVPKAELGQPGDTSRRPRARRALTVEEFRKLTGCPRVREWRQRFYEVAGLSGLRAGELRQLAPCDFVLGARPRWRLRPEITKAGRLDDVPMLPECAAALQQLVVGKGEVQPIFGRRPHPRTVEQDLGRAGVAKHDARGRQADAHSLRYFFCALVGRVLPIQRVRQLMRHRDIQTTARIYLDLGIADIAEKLETLPALLGGRGANKKPHAFRREALCFRRATVRQAG